MGRLNNGLPLRFPVRRQIIRRDIVIGSISMRSDHDAGGPINSIESFDKLNRVFAWQPHGAQHLITAIQRGCEGKRLSVAATQQTFLLILDRDTPPTDGETRVPCRRD